MATVLHMCFGYAALVPGGKPTANSFLPELADCSVDQVSIEAAQPRLDLGVLRELGDKRSSLACSIWATPR